MLPTALARHLCHHALNSSFESQLPEDIQYMEIDKTGTWGDNDNTNKRNFEYFEQNQQGCNDDVDDDNTPLKQSKRTRSQGKNKHKVVSSDDKQPVSPQEWPGLRENPDIWNNTISRFSTDSQLQLIIGLASRRIESQASLEAWLSFPYCAFVFPKRKGHGTHDLLNQWCSLGITTRQRGQSCISKLLKSRLLLLEKPASSASVVSDGDGSNVKVGGALGLPIGERSIIAKGQIVEEDFTHDFARYLLGDWLIVVDGRNGSMPPSSHMNESAYLALVSNLNAEQSDISGILPPGILALRFEDCREMELGDGVFAFAKYLRLLDLSGCSVKKLPSSIRHMKQLRYLKAPRIQDEVWPLGGLHELRYLNLQRSCLLSDLTEPFLMLRIESLCESSFCGQLRSLSHLNLSGCSGLKALPTTFGKLRRLRHLDLSGFSGIGYLTKLPNELRHLDLSGCSGLKVAAKDELSGKLLHLNLSGCSALERLPLFWDINDLQHFDLSGCSMLENIPDSSSYSVLRSLMYLDMLGCLRLQVRENMVLDVRRRGGKVSGPKDAKLMIDPETTVLNKLRGHLSEVDKLRFCS
ncbi:putative disease resistance protein RGA1 [Panicum miliaceum]|uniref:Disease resistance protein RGA1 n=1 Tax=Panicum miliaceum TaxID=4540 RepID=A0A3L6PZG8_PANMI|nr:putative disease resistance protein RGA1 [Panicum miliaceum]